MAARNPGLKGAGKHLTYKKIFGFICFKLLPCEKTFVRLLLQEIQEELEIPSDYQTREKDIMIAETTTREALD